MQVFTGIVQSSQDAVGGGKVMSLLQGKNVDELNAVVTACTTGNNLQGRYKSISDVVYAQHYQTITELETQIKHAKNLIASSTELSSVNQFSDASGAMNWVKLTTKIVKMAAGNMDDDDVDA